MPNDRDKLLTIINNLELDFRAGNISKDKYEYLINEYNRRLQVIEYNMAKNGNNSNISTGNLNDSLGGSDLEDQELINKFIVRKNNTKKEKKSLGHGAIIAIATVALLLAFAGGIGFGVFNFDFNANSIAMFGQVAISDTAFPVVVPNVTVNTSNYTSSNTYYNSSKYSNYSDTSHDWDDSDDSDYSGDSSSKHDSSSSSNSNSGSNSGSSSRNTNGNSRASNRGSSSNYQSNNY